MKSFNASFLLEIRSIRVVSEDVNQSGLEVVGHSAASLAASVMWFSKSWSSSSLVDSTAIFGSRLGKNSETFFWNLPFWLLRRRKLSILVLVTGVDSLFFSARLESKASFERRKFIQRAAWSLSMLSSFLLTSLVWHSCSLGISR